MAEFNPPDSHWAGDFDARLLGTFHHLKERLDRLEAELRVLRSEERGRNEQAAQAIRDMKHRAEKGGKP